MAQGAADEGRDAEGKSSRWLIALFVCIALFALLLVAGLGQFQFSHRADLPIRIIKSHAVPGTDVTIGERILDFIKGKGIKVVSEGFKPSWGAEETGRDVWVVSYVFEVGRESRWVSWKVYPKSGKVIPRDEMAGELWEGN